MDFSVILFSFRRAFFHSLDKRRLLASFCALLLCGAVVLFCYALTSSMHPWAAIGFSFCPFFLCSAILAPTGVFFIRSYYHAITSRSIEAASLLKQSWQLMCNSACLFFAFLLVHLSLWMLLGVFFVVQSIPLIGESISMIVAAVPLLIILMMILLSLSAVCAIFFYLPLISLKEKAFDKAAMLLWIRFKMHFLTYLFLLLLSLVPFALTTFLILLATLLMKQNYLMVHHNFAAVLQALCLLLPIAALLAPSLCFFFHFSVESASLVLKACKK